ncbi:MAG: hypothetical protein HRT88_19715 [Lentisphaeraceae bacterium]|nr:hypothetical protein [Lentisphaeraceae bacterium]
MRLTSKLMATASIAAACLLTSCSKEEVAAKKIDSAKAISEVAIADLTQGNPEILWQGLPASYQKDVKDSIIAYTANTDKALHDKVFSVTDKLANVLSKQKPFIIAFMKEKGKDQKKVDLTEIEKNWNDVVGIVKAFSSSDLSSIEKLKALDPQNFLATTGKTILSNIITLQKSVKESSKPGQSFTDIAKTTVKEVETTADAAKIEFTNPVSKEVEVVDFVKVEGKWLPKDMVDGWKKQITELQAKLKKGSEMTAKDKMKFTMVLGSVDGVLDNFLAAKNQDEFDAAIKSTMGVAMGLMMGGAF